MPFRRSQVLVLGAGIIVLAALLLRAGRTEMCAMPPVPLDGVFTHGRTDENVACGRTAGTQKRRFTLLSSFPEACLRCHGGIILGIV